MGMKTSETALPDHISLIRPLSNDAALDGSSMGQGTANDEMRMVPLGRLHPDPDNIRHEIGDVSEMAESMRAIGVLQPLLVSPHPSRAGHFLIKAGHRRRAAAEEAGLAEAPCYIRKTIIGAGSTVQSMLIENFHRVALNPIEIADGMGYLRKKLDWSGRRIAKATGMHESTVSGYLALLEASDDTKAKVARRELAATDVIAAVRKQRARKSKSRGLTDRRVSTALSWDPPFFTKKHPLGRRAQFFCDTQEHNGRRRLGKEAGFPGACDYCWDRAIRENERKLVIAELTDQIRAELQAGLTSAGNATVMTREEHQAARASLETGAGES